MLKTTEGSLLERGLLKKPILQEDINYSKVVGVAYNKYFSRVIRDFSQIDASDFSEIVDRLFLSDRHIKMKKPLTLPKGFGFKKENTTLLYFDKKEEPLFFNKREVILLSYKEGKNWDNYLITLLGNATVDMARKLGRDYTKGKDLLRDRQENQSYETPSDDLEYHDTLKILVKRSKKEHLDIYKENLPSKLFKTTLQLKDLGFSSSDIANLFLCKISFINKVMDSIVNSLLNLSYKDEVGVSLGSINKGMDAKPSLSELPLSVNYSELVSNLKPEVVESINKIRESKPWQ
jgi:hypothetical protein